jgi:hypothetical protein
LNKQLKGIENMQELRDKLKELQNRVATALEHL